jgi:hypothetical protein
MDLSTLDAHLGWSHQVTVSMVEIYNENVRDLLAEPPAGADKRTWTLPQLEIRQSENGVYLPGEQASAGGVQGGWRCCGGPDSASTGRPPRASGM